LDGPGEWLATTKNTNEQQIKGERRFYKNTEEKEKAKNPISKQKQENRLPARPF
jgi:hypothetical protein